MLGSRVCFYDNGVQMTTGITKQNVDVWHLKGNNWKQFSKLKSGTPVSGEVRGEYFYLDPKRRTKKKWIKIDAVIVVPPPVEPPPVSVNGFARIVWDDENIDYDYKCRTQQSGWSGPDNPPAVMRFYPEPREKSGDFRVRLGSPYDWKPVIISVNDGDEQKFDYLTGPARATYNKTGWDKQAYITMSGNYIEVLEVSDDWVKFKTMKPEDVFAAVLMTRESEPQYIHKFTCVTFDRNTKTTKRIDSTGTPRGQVYYFLVTNEGYAYIPRRHVIIEA